MPFVSFSEKISLVIKSLLLLGQRMLGDSDWKTAFSDSDWRHLTMECAWGLARQHRSCCTGNVCTQLLFRCAFLKFWHKHKNAIFCHPKLSPSSGGKLGKAMHPLCAPIAVDALAGSGTRAQRYHIPAQAPLPHWKPTSALSWDETHVDLLS